MSLIRILITFTLVGSISCASPDVTARKFERTPPTFKVKFKTTKGDFTAIFNRAWSPEGAERVYHLVRNKFYDHGAFFRVVDNYVAQFGINNDSLINKYWGKKSLKDEPVIFQNIKGTISFARGGPESRSTQLFINLQNNSPRLDTLGYLGVKGFPVIGQITEGLQVIDSLYSDYGNNPIQDSIRIYGDKYLKRHFPKLDYIKSARLTK